MDETFTPTVAGRQIMAARMRKADNTNDRNNLSPARLETSEKQELFASLGLRQLRSWLFGAVAALTAATLILNGDGLTFEGDNILIALLWQFLAAALLFARWYRNKPFSLDEHGDEAKGQTAARWFDVVATVFFVWVFVSFAVAWCSGNGAPRAMLTMLAHWGGFAAMFVTWRLLLNGRLMIRGMLLLLVAAVVGESSAAYYHYYHAGPQTRQQYFDSQKQASVTNDGSQMTGEQQLYQNRIESPEPLGTYSLTNSLAGVLAPWCVFLCGVLLLGKLHAPFNRNWMRVTAMMLMSMIAFVVFILMMTNSRSGNLAALFGVTCLMGYMIAARVRNKRMILGVVVGVCLVIVTGLGIGFVTDEINRIVLTEAMKSFGYRIQYWQSSSQMIADHPLFGCGIGNFRENYTLYKLPIASETISDPHNLFFEVASNAGLPALACFVVLLMAAIVCALASQQDEDTISDQLKSTNRFERIKKCWQTRQPFFIGGAVGIIAAFIYSLTNNAPMSFDMTCFVLAGFVLGFLLFIPVIDSAVFPLKVLAPICLAALSVNLLAAGGISFPHVNLTFWFFMVLCFNRASDFRLQTSGENIQHNPEARSPKSEVFVFVAICFLVLGIVLYPTAWLANLQANSLLRNMEANPAQYASLVKTIAAWEKVVKNDPYRTQVWCDLCAAYLMVQRGLPDLAQKRDDSSGWRAVVEQQMQKAGISHDLRQVTLNDTTADALVGAIRSSPLSATNYQNLGTIFFDDFEKTKNRGSLDLAIVLFHLAAKCYPNHALSYAWLADCCNKSGEQELQYENARRAIELDDIMPHSDQKLPLNLRRMVEQLYKNE